MAHEIIALISHYGLLVVFLSVLVDQLGLPVPGLAVLVVAGALAVTGQMSLPAIFAVALVACLLADFAWYGAGRYLGARVLRMLCRISLSPDSCVNRSELSFERWRGKILVVAKFVPGLSMVAPPLAGAMGLRSRVFLLFDGLGSLLWVGVWVGLGYVFAAQIDQLLTSLTSAGKVAIDLVLGVLAVFIFIKWWHRRRLLIQLRMPRITVAELKQSIEAGLAPLIVDVRSAVSRQLDPWIVDGALLADPAHIEQALAGTPLDLPLVIYCSCPNEATSARAAKRLIAHGYLDVQPLRGGLAEWKKADSPIKSLPVADSN